MVITSLDNDRIKNYIKLKDRKNRKKTNTFIVEGLHSVIEAYKSNLLIEVILEEHETFNKDVPHIYVTNDILKKISSLDTPSKIMGLCKMKPECELGGKVLLLDNIQDPGNLGTIIRSAVAFNIDTIVLSKDTVDLYNPKVLRSTQGMIFHTNVIIDDLEAIISKLKEKNIKIYGTSVENGIDVRNFTHNDKESFGLIMGNEGNGIRDSIKKLCDSFIYIDMNKNVESLNVSVATSIILYELNMK